MNGNRKCRSTSGSFRLENLENRQMLSGGGVFPGGTGNSFAIASDGTLYLAYYQPSDSLHGILKYAIRDPNGTWRAPGSDNNTIDSVGGGTAAAQVGLYVSMALDSTG